MKLALGCCTYVAVTAEGDSLGEFMLPADKSHFPQPEAAEDHPTWDEWDSCVGRWHY